jgi:hypothetical protein
VLNSLLILPILYFSVEYLGVMAWAAQFQWIPDQDTPADMVEMKLGRALDVA